MHVERGPQGKILVFEVLAGAEIVQHIYEGLQVFPCQMFFRSICARFLRKTLCGIALG